MYPAILALLSAAPLAVLAAQDVPASSITAAQWEALNTTLGGKLYTALPFSAPCFSVVDGVNVTTDTTACAAIEANYTNPLYRVEQFGAWMLVRITIYSHTEKASD